MPNLSQEISLKIVEKFIGVAIKETQDTIEEQIRLRNIVEEVLNNYEIAEKSTELATGDILEKAFIFLSCKKLEGMSESTRYNYTLLFKRMGEYFIKPISTITTIELRLFLAAAYKDNQPASINNKICKIKAFFTWLQDEGYLLQNPSKNLRLVNEPVRRRGHINQLDIEKMREGCKTVRDKALFEFMLSTGCRVSEISDALISKIDWEKNSINVIGKGNKERIVFFSVRARLFLIEYINERQSKGILSDSLFVSSKTPHGKLGGRSIEKDVKKFAENAGITYSVFPHLFRHTFATTSINRDVPVHVLSALMGHNSVDTTSIYYDLADENISREYKKIAL